MAASSHRSIGRRRPSHGKQYSSPRVKVITFVSHGRVRWKEEKKKNQVGINMGNIVKHVDK